MKLLSFSEKSLFITLLFFCGCTTTNPNPLAEFVTDFDEQPSEKLEADLRDYKNSLTPEERKVAGPSFWLKDHTGKHAFDLNVGLNGTSWHHILIYDSHGDRIQVIKYKSGNYGS